MFTNKTLPKMAALFCCSLSLLFAVTGCQTVGNQSPNGMAIKDGQIQLPHDRYLVGGGAMIEYTARQSGTLIYANAANGFIIQTQSVDAGDDTEFMMAPDAEELGISEESIQMILGKDPTNAQLVLYFIPDAENQDNNDQTQDN